MSETDAGAAPEHGLAEAGGWLRQAREQAGLSIDAVAQQLKLAPRQVKALEDGDFAELPGRTFVRGFMRNYARLLKLDPEAVVAALPSADAAPALEGPSIGSASRPMGELPATHASRSSTWSRWLIPIALLALVALGATYELTRQKRAPTADAPAIKTLPAEPVAPASTGAGIVGTPLPNPVTGTLGAAEPPRQDTAPAAPVPVPTPPSAPASIATPTTLTAAEAPAASPPAAANEGVLVIQYRSPAWTRVRDASGEVLLITTGQPGTEQVVRGRPPLELVLGNANDASVAWRGQPFDLAPHVRGNVARVRLP